MIHALRGRTRNGLPWRTGYTVLAILHMGEVRGAPYVESHL